METYSTQNKILFRSKEHGIFYKEYLEKCRYIDVYHQALIYCLGLNNDTRKNVNRIYDFKTGCVKTECLQEGWQTSGSMKVIRMAFNLYCNSMPSVKDYKSKDEQLREAALYSAEDLFCCSYGKYFFEAVKIRYPEYF